MESNLTLVARDAVLAELNGKYRQVVHKHTPGLLAPLVAAVPVDETAATWGDVLEQLDGVLETSTTYRGAVKQLACMRKLISQIANLEEESKDPLAASVVAYYNAGGPIDKFNKLLSDYNDTQMTQQYTGRERFMCGECAPVNQTIERVLNILAMVALTVATGEMSEDVADGYKRCVDRYLLDMGSPPGLTGGELINALETRRNTLKSMPAQVGAPTYDELVTVVRDVTNGLPPYANVVAVIPPSYSVASQIEWVLGGDTFGSGNGFIVIEPSESS